MLTKLFKYEVKATSRMILPFYIGLLGLTVLFRIFSVFKMRGRWIELQRIFGAVAIAVFVILLMATFFVCFIVMVTRFYKNLYGDEGYLMNTLPVTPAQNIAAKLLCSVLWYVVSILVCGLTGFIFFFGDYLPQVTSSFREFWQILIHQILPQLSAQQGAAVAGIGFELFLLIAISLFTAPLMMYFCISVGQKLTRHNILGTFGCYLAVTFSLQTISAIAMMVFGMVVNPAWFDQFIFRHPAGFFSICLGGLILSEIVLGTLFFFATNHLLSKKLNLE